MNTLKNRNVFALLALCFTSFFVLTAQAAPVSYAAQLKTSRLNPVTDILILEADAEGTVHATIYPHDLPGDGYGVILHNPAYQPVRSLIIGLTNGEDEFGEDKIQLVMFLADDFAIAKKLEPYSVAFPGAKHSLTINSLLAAVGGDADEMAWFTDTFFTGPAAEAVFDTHGSFTVAEFTVLVPIGGDETRATFLVTKDFTDGNPNEVTVTLDCNTGLILDQSKDISEGKSVEFVVTEFDEGELNCHISEVVPNGYSAAYGVNGNQGGAAGGVTANAQGCHFTEVVGGAFACQIVNTPDPVDIVITKEWVIEGSSTAQDIDTRYDLILRCDAEIIGGYIDGYTTLEAPAGLPYIACGLGMAGVDSGQTVPGGPWCKVFQGDGPDVFIAEVIPDYPESDCEVVERVYDSAVEVDNGCGHLVFSAGQGASCTITNTVFFEGIPTLNQYGIALLALIMMGVGLVGFRRFI